MLAQNKRFSDICNITQYHSNNIKGQGIKIAVFDKPFKPGSPIFNNKVHHMGAFSSGDYPLVSHGSSACYVIHQILPEAEIYFLPNSTESIYWCIENDIDIISISMSWGGSRTGYLEASQKAVEGGMLLLTSAGNSSEDWMLKRPARKKPWIAVGAAHLMNPGKPSEYITRASYSSYTRDDREIWEMVEIMGFARAYIISPYNTTEPYRFGGTSCACPWVAGMTGLLKQVKYLNKQRFRELEFMRKHTIDMEEEGHDKETGYGLFVLPEPSKVPFEVGLTAEKAVRLKAASTRPGTLFRFDARPMGQGDFQMLKDYSSDLEFVWAPGPGAYEVVLHAVCDGEYQGKYMVCDVR